MTGNGADSVPNSPGTVAASRLRIATVAGSLGHHPGTARPAFLLQPARPIERAVHVKIAGPIERAVGMHPARPIERAVATTPECVAAGAIQVPAGTLRLQARSLGAEPVPVRGQAPPVVDVGVRPNVSGRPLRPESITLQRRGRPIVPPRFESRPLRPQCVAHARHSSRVCAVLARSGRLARPVQSVAVSLLAAPLLANPVLANRAQLSLSLVPPLRAGDEASCARPTAMIRSVIAGVPAPISDCPLPCGVIWLVSPAIPVPSGVRTVRVKPGSAGPI